MKKALTTLCFLAMSLFMNSLLHAQVLTIDYLAGTGEFESCNLSKFYSSYTGPDYDYHQRKGQVCFTGKAWKGVYYPQEKDCISDGWTKILNSNTNPTNVEYRSLLRETGSNYSQGIFITEPAKGQVARLLYRVPFGKGIYSIKPGDQVVLHIGYLHLPEKECAGVSYDIKLSSGPETEQVSFNKEIADDVTLSLTIPEKVNELTVTVGITNNSKEQDIMPWMVVDSISLHKIQRDGSEYTLLDKVFLSNKPFKTCKVIYSPSNNCLYTTAKNNELIIISGELLPYITHFRDVNPQIRVFLYGSAGELPCNCDNNGNDCFPSYPVGFSYVQKEHPEWLHVDENGNYIRSRETSVKSYYTDISSNSYREVWTKRFLEICAVYLVDGVFIDTLIPLNTQNKNGLIIRPERKPWVVQKFIHEVYPIIHSAGLSIVQNNYGLHRHSGVGVVFYSPFFDKSASFNSSEYASNIGQTISDYHYQESAFIRFQTNGPNLYTEEYWLNCIEDMDAVKEMNESEMARTPDYNNQYEIMNVSGRDSADDPAMGWDGWVFFCLCSYLLAQNEYTYVGATYSKQIYPLETKNHITNTLWRLDSPLSVREKMYDDPLFQYRLYSLRGCNKHAMVIVNAHSEESKSIVLFEEVKDEGGDNHMPGDQIKMAPRTAKVLFYCSE